MPKVSHEWRSRAQDDVLHCGYGEYLRDSRGFEHYAECDFPKWMHPGNEHLDPSFQRKQRLDLLRVRARAIDGSSGMSREAGRLVSRLFLDLIEEIER